MTSMERILADFIKGAERAGGAVQMGEPGQETKLAVTLGELAGLGGLGALGAVDADPGHRGRGALGAMAGGALGGLSGMALGDLVGMPQLGKLLGAGLGAGAGGHFAGHAPQPSMLDRVQSKLSAAHAAGVEAAKVAFLGPLLSAGASALAPAAARGVLGKVAPKALGALAKPVTGALFDTGVQMGAQKALQ